MVLVNQRNDSNFNKTKLNPETRLIDFPLSERWMNGEEYAFLIRHYLAYAKMFPDQISISNCGHPEDVYEQPRSK